MAEIKRVGIIGAGQMGGGIAHVCALAGYDVLINDLEQQRIDDCLLVIDHNMSRQVSRGIVGELDKREAFARISAAPTLADLSDVTWRSQRRPRTKRPRRRSSRRCS